MKPRWTEAVRAQYLRADGKVNGSRLVNGIYPLRKKGMTLREIARHTGFSHSVIHNAVSRHCAGMPEDLMTIPEIAALMSVSEQAVRVLLRARGWETKKFGGKRLLTEATAHLVTDYYRATLPADAIKTGEWLNLKQVARMFDCAPEAMSRRLYGAEYACIRRHKSGGNRWLYSAHDARMLRSGQPLSLSKPPAGYVPAKAIALDLGLSTSAVQTWAKRGAPCQRIYLGKISRLFFLPADLIVWLASHGYPQHAQRLSAERSA